MKKVLSLLLATMMLIPCFALADVDFSAMTDDEILECKEAIQQQLYDRKLVQSVNIGTGKLTVGIDLPEGDYSFVNDRDIGPCSVKIFENESDYINGEKAIDTFHVRGFDKIAKVTLKEGQFIVIIEGNFVISQYAGMLFQ